MSLRPLLHGLRLLWLSAWPLWSLVLLACLVFIQSLPEGYGRALVAAPILLMVPGSLTLGAVFSQRVRPQGAAFVACSALLSLLCLAFASLALYVSHVLITAISAYWCVLLISAVLAIASETRVLFGQGKGRRAAGNPRSLDSDMSGTEDDEVEMTSGARRGAIYHVVAAAILGGGLLAGGLLTYNHLPRPAPKGYTWIAWTGPPMRGPVPVGPGGTKLGFRVVHHQTGTATFRLSAVWLGRFSRPLASSIVLNIGPDKTFRGALFVPPLPDGCTYRIVVALSAVRKTDRSNNVLKSWSINADVHDPSQSLKKCK
jgi:hypothetical protein